MRAKNRKAAPKSRRSPTRLKRATKSVARKRRARPASISASARHVASARKTTRRKRQPKDLLGMIKSNIEKTAHRLGDNVEKTGRKLRRSGNPRAGKMIERVGNRLEHVVGG